MDDTVGLAAQLQEIRFLIAEAHDHIDLCPECSCGKSGDGHVSLNWGPWDDDPTITVRHRCGFDAQEFYWSEAPEGVIDHSSHFTTFATIDAAVTQVRIWHAQEMAKDHSRCTSAWSA